MRARGVNLGALVSLRVWDLGAGEEPGQVLGRGGEETGVKIKGVSTEM